MRTFVQSNAVVQTTGNNLDSRQILQISAMHFRTDIADMFLYFPNTFTRSSFTPEQTDITSIRLRIIGTNQAKQGGFSGTILSAQCPFFAPTDCPIKFFKNSTIAITDTDFIEFYDLLRTIIRITIRQIGNTLLQFCK